MEVRMVVLAALLVTAGCVGRRMEAWVGRPGDELLGRWGAPDHRLQQRDGSRVLTWNEAWLDAEFHTCRKSFVIGRDGRIRQWTASDCHVWASVPAPPRAR